jgi:hypothetical protein
MTNQHQQQQQQQRQQPPQDLDLLVADDESTAPKISNDIYTQTMESFLRIALAGFGGAVVGLSLSKRGGITSATKQAVVARRGRYHHATSGDLPAQWAMACVTFASIFEGTRALSPTTLVLKAMDGSVDDNMFQQQHSPYTKYLCTVGDYAVGGTMAGTILRGLPVAGARPGIAAPRLGAGLFAGLFLGVVPGVMVATITVLEDYLKEAEEQAKTEEEEAASLYKHEKVDSSTS